MTPHELELAYARIEVPDPDALGPCLTDIVGLAPSDPTPAGDDTWTDDDAVHRVIVGRGDADDLVALGLEAIDDDAFDTVVARLAAAGFHTTPGTDADLAERRVRRLARVTAPWGGAVEIVTGLQRGATPELPLMPGGFLTAGQGFGHVVVATTDFAEALRFAGEGLGMRQSDWLVSEVVPGIELEVRFLHCNARHHSIAIARAPFELPQALHHLMFEANDRDDVGAAFDRAYNADLPLPNGLGQHENDRMFSFYLETPAGFQIEVGYGARPITEPWTDDRRYERMSAWGHQYLGRR